MYNFFAQMVLKPRPSVALRKPLHVLTEAGVDKYIHFSGPIFVYEIH